MFRKYDKSQRISSEANFVSKGELFPGIQNFPCKVLAVVMTLNQR